MDRQGEFHATSSNPCLFTPSALALWRFRRRFRERDFVHRPGNTNSIRHLRQPVAVTICDMSGADTVYPVSRRADDVCSICRDPDADEHVANGGRQAGKLPRRAFQAERPYGQGSVHGCAEYDVGSEAAAGGPDIEWPTPSVSFV